MTLMELSLFLMVMVWRAQADLNMKVRTIVEKDVSYCIVNGVRYAVGQPFKLSMTGRCIELVCDGYGKLSESRAECDDSGSCRPVGYIKRESCLEQRCERRGNVVAFFTYREECNYKGQCHAMGVPWLDREDCINLVCNKKMTWNGRLMYAIDSVGLQCKDAYGTCRQPGERFVYNIKGTLRNDCYCRITGNSVYTYCN